MNIRKSIKTLKWQLFMALSVVFMALMSCSYTEDKAIEQTIVNFAHNYFNLRYAEAMKFCTPESEKWVRFKATNITQEEVDSLNARTEAALCDIESVDLEDDANATVVVDVRNFLNCDTIGKPAVVCPDAKFRLSLKKVNEQWLVDIHEPI